MDASNAYRAGSCNLDDDLVESDGVPEDGRQAWLSLLVIGLVTGASGTLLCAVARVIP